MPSHRIRRGWHDASAMTSAYEWTSLPRASDQRHLRYEIVSPSGFLSEADTVIQDTLDKSVGVLGFWNGTIYLAAVTPGMVQVLRDNIFTTDGLNEQITIVHYTVTQGWVCLQGWGRLRVARPGDVAAPRPGSGAIVNLSIDFDTGTEAAPGGDFNEDFGTDFSYGGIPE